MLEFIYFTCSNINISINTHEIHKCPRGEIGRHKGLKIEYVLFKNNCKKNTQFF